MSALFEANLDGLVGPTHNYAGIAPGNEASQANAGNISNPRLAALQGLKKMRLMHDLGVRQLVMPPHPRPNTGLLESLGFRGSLRSKVEDAVKYAPSMLPYIYSASGMWAANAATVAPSVDATDGKIHFTAANLIGTAHRAIEPPFAFRALKRIFPADAHFVHHPALPANLMLSDEGAANHMRLQLPDGTGMHVFVYGRELPNMMQHTKRHPARQGKLASEAVARHHHLRPERSFFIRQNPDMIDAGVFHNDVIATSHEHVLLYHELSFIGGDAPVEQLQKAAGGALCLIRIPTAMLSVEDAVRSYLFNSQLVRARDGFLLIAPGECETVASAKKTIQYIIDDPANPVQRVQFVDLRESMSNGGGPACLRLRVQMKEAEWQAVHPGVIFTPVLHDRLNAWVEAHYRERITPADLTDPALAEEAVAALLALETILDMPGLYAEIDR